MEEITICVVGLGYVGLPTGIAFHSAGFRVIGVDVSDEVINQLMDGRSPLIDSSSYLKIPVESDRWMVSSDFSESIPLSDVVLVTVPTPVNEDKSPDLSFVERASKSVLENLDKGKKTAVVLESTVYPGVTRRILGGLCDEIGISQEEVIIAYCPERVNPGDFERGIESVAQIVGCDDQDWGEWLAVLFGKITSESSTFVGKMEVAEASKLIENVQRDIDIALANELSLILPNMGIDVEEVLEAAATKWNFHRHTPGIGVGGHCIPVDPYYYIELSEKVGATSMLSTASRSINNSMPGKSASQILDILVDHDDPHVLILGYSYKANVGDIRETPVEPLAKYLFDGGCEILIHDPLVKDEDFPNWAKIVDVNDYSGEFDLVILATFHKEFLLSNGDFWENLLSKMRIGDDGRAKIYDGRRSLDKGKMNDFGWEYFGVGVPRP
jgi:nucleotide sugar dehydrogenase